MYFFLVASGVTLHVLFWGMGAALLAMPRPWKKFWPLLAAPTGFALQSLIVWLGAYANLRGTNAYAWWSEIVPFALLGVAFFRRGGAAWIGDVKRFWGVWLATAVCLGMLILPMAIGAKGAGLSTLSLGSCDAADYAAGARVLKEFAHSDRSGFLGLTEVVSVMSATNFFDFWLRLNHFTPSALIALNGTLFDCSPHELTGIMTAVLLATSLPTVFWLARAVLRYSPRVSLWIALLYGFSPITWYAVFQVAMAQLLAAQAIILLTWAGVVLWRSRMTWRRGLAMSGVLFIGYALVLGAYNFILLVALIPAVAYAGGLALWGNEWRRFFRWLALMLVPLAIAGLVFFERVAGLAERFRLFQTYDFGWRIPALSPEGWLGMVTGSRLEAFSLGWRVPLAGLIIVAIVISLVRGAKERRREVYVVVSLVVPALVGYGYLNLRGVQLGTNASYDAYKILSVFYPGLLAGLCYWITLSHGRTRIWRGLAMGLGVLVTGFTANAAYRFGVRMEFPPLLVGRELTELKKVEGMSDVASVNMRMPDMWSRLWANAFLLHEQQYFTSHTYEGRLNTPLKGDWDLNGGLIELKLPEGGSRRINANFSLANTHSPYFMRVRTGEGWYELERQTNAVQRWRWTRGNATLLLENPQARPLHLLGRFLNLHSLVERDFQVWLGKKRIKVVQVGPSQIAVRLPEMEIPPGVTTLEIRTTAPLTGTAGDDIRQLGFRIFGIELEVLPDDANAGGR